MLFKFLCGISVIVAVESVWIGQATSMWAGKRVDLQMSPFRLPTDESRDLTYLRGTSIFVLTSTRSS